MYLAHAAGHKLEQHIRDEPGADAVRDRVGERHHGEREKRRDCLGGIVPSDRADLAHPQKADQHEERSGRLRRPPAASGSPSSPAPGRGKFPASSRYFASWPTATTVPTVSKKSDSMIENTVRIAAAAPSTRRKPKLTWPTSPKSGAATSALGSSATWGAKPAPSARATRAATVLAAMPISSAPRTLRATSHAVNTSVRPKRPIPTPC